MLLGGRFDCAQFEAIELVTVEDDLALTLSRQCHVQAQAIGDVLRIGLEQNLVRDRVQAEAQRTGAFVEDGRVAADDQLCTLGRSLLRLLIAVDIERRGLDLALTLEHITDQLTFKHRAGGADHQLASVTTYGITRLVAALRRNQGVVVVVGTAPTRVGIFIALVETAIENVTRCLGQFIQTPVRAFKPGLLNVATLHVHRTARHIELGILLGDHFLARERQRAALGHPLADGMPLGAQITTDFQQTTGGVPAICGVTVGARRDEHQFAQIDPYIVVGQLAAFTVHRRIALLVTLNVDLDVVGFHRHLDANRARHVNHCPIANQTALARCDRNLTTRGQGGGTVLELHGAAADDLDPRLVDTISDGAQVVKQPGGVVDRIWATVEVDQAVITLAVKRRGVGTVQQNGRGAALAQGDSASAVSDRVQQVNRASGIHRSTGQGHTVLLDLVPGQRDVTGRGHDQPVVADLTGRATGL